MPDNHRKDLCKYRLEKAHECISSAKLLNDSNDYLSSVNRSYYAMFHAVRAIMALDGVDRKKHSGVVSYFQEHYIKTELLPKECSYFLKNAFIIRQESDYEDFCIISKQEVQEQIQNAEQMLKDIEAFLKDKEERLGQEK